MKLLFVCGSLNQTRMAHAVARHLGDCESYFAPYYYDGVLKWLARAGLLEFTVSGGNFRSQTEEYLRDNRLSVDLLGQQHGYDLAVTTSDLVVQKNICGKPLMLIQEGMTDPEGLMYWLVKQVGLPRYLASTAATGLSDAYDYFCVASHGYREHFIRKGVRPEKLIVTGIPNFDDIERFRYNSFPQRDFVLVATSDARETFKLDNRMGFLRRCVALAAGRPLIVKLHPNENVDRATREILSVAPEAQIFSKGCVEEMIANCSVLITQYSSVAYVGLALNKEVHSYFDVEELRRLMPIQNGGQSAANIAAVCRRLMAGTPVQPREFYAVS